MFGHLTTYGGYPDARLRMSQLRGIGGIGQVATPFNYVPDLAPVGSGAAYFPRNTTEDAKALNFLGFMDDESLRFHPGSMGSQKADIGNNVGAWDPAFRAAVTRYEAARNLKADSFIGPQVRTQLKIDVDAKNAAGVPAAPVGPLPAVIIPVDPGGIPGGSTPLPGISDDDSTTLYVVGGVGLLVLGTIGYLVLR